MRICFADCGRDAPECRCRAEMLEQIAKADRERALGVASQIGRQTYLTATENISEPE